MAIIKCGFQDTTLIVDPTFKSIRITPYPNDVIGSYAIASRTGSIAAGTIASSTLWSFKYTGANICVIKNLSVFVAVTAAYTQGVVRLSAYFVRGTYTQGTTNATLVNTFQQNGAKRSTMPTSSALIYTATTAGMTVDATTGTFDAQPLGSAVVDLPASLVARPLGGYYKLIDGLQTNVHPVVLTQNEGVRILNDTVYPATGTSILGVLVEWDEVASY